MGLILDHVIPHSVNCSETQLLKRPKPRSKHNFETTQNQTQDKTLKRSKHNFEVSRNQAQNATLKRPKAKIKNGLLNHPKTKFRRQSWSGPEPSSKHKKTLNQTKTKLKTQL